MGAVDTLSDEQHLEVLQSLVVLSLRIAASGAASDSGARASLERSATQALSLVDRHASVEFLRKLQQDYETGQFLSLIHI